MGESVDADRLQRAVSGDLAALTLELQRTRGQLRELLQVRIPADLRAALDADDLVQETHVEVFRHIRTFQPQGSNSFARWIGTIAIRKLRDAIKRSRAEKRGGGRRGLGAAARGATESTVMMLDLLATQSRTPSRSVAELEVAGAMQDALNELPVHYRRAVTLVYLQDRPVAEAAAELGVTDRAVHGLCRRALKMLRERLKRSGPFRSESLTFPALDA